MPIHMKRWCDKIAKTDGYRLLVCRARPRGLPAGQERWDGWCSGLGPSATLEGAFRTATQAISWDDYQRRYLEEMKAQGEIIDEIARLALEGKTITLLCSKACKNEGQCHRSLLKRLIETRMEHIQKTKN